MAITVLLLPAIGIGSSPDHGVDAKSLITHAAAAQHHALSTDATGDIIYSNATGDHARERMALEAALREAVRAEQLTLRFQPKIRVADGALVGVEALLAGSIRSGRGVSGSLHPAG